MDKNYGQMMVEGFVRAIPWAVVFSAAFVLSAGIVANLLKQEIKEAVEYSAKTVIRQSVHTLLTDPGFNRDLLPKIKQNVKEAVEFTFSTANRHPIVVMESKAAARR
jgi:hypothetical protein